KRHDRQSTSEDEQSGAREVREDLPKDTSRSRGHWTRGHSRDERREHEGGGRASAPPSPDERRDEPGQEKQPDDLRLSPGRHDRAHDEERPDEPIATERDPRELQDASADDRNDCGTDSVEEPLQPR